MLLFRYVLVRSLFLSLGRQFVLSTCIYLCYFGPPFFLSSCLYFFRSLVRSLFLYLCMSFVFASVVMYLFSHFVYFVRLFRFVMVCFFWSLFLSV